MTGTHFREWIDEAEEDYLAAVTLGRRRSRPTPSAAAFHCQQCAEKYLKAWLVKHGRNVPRTHDLLELHRLCVETDLRLAVLADLLDSLNPYAVEFRYPGEAAAPEEARAAIRSVTQVRRLLRRLLGIV
jgi:HEPN domain-containing protein